MMGQVGMAAAPPHRLRTTPLQLLPDAGDMDTGPRQTKFIKLKKQPAKQNRKK